MRTWKAWVGGSVLVLSLMSFAGEAQAGGGRSGGYSNGLGTGSNPRSYSVRPYTRQDGTYVLPHSRSMPNQKWRDNWSTKPNVNPYTGKEGNRLSPRNQDQLEPRRNGFWPDTTFRGVRTSRSGAPVHSPPHTVEESILLSRPPLPGRPDSRWTRPTGSCSHPANP